MVSEICVFVELFTVPILQVNVIALLLLIQKNSLSKVMVIPPKPVLMTLKRCGDQYGVMENEYPLTSVETVEIAHGCVGAGVGPGVVVGVEDGLGVGCDVGSSVGGCVG